ncbi:MAG: Re/Si-specific NAD(P)(+) transhydrogenase subunit alpha [Thermoplasmata archaeon]
MNVSVPRETEPGERRVALVPEAAARLVKEGLEVRIEASAGDGAHFPDEAYEEAGAQIVPDASSLWGKADILVKVGPPIERRGEHEVDMLREGSVLIGFLNPLADLPTVKRLASRRVTAFSMEMIPRISRAQSMDALSSQATVAGYKASLIGATALGKFFPMLTTAAGTVRPAKVFVIGAGVAGLQAISAARRLGAVVEAFDIRPAVKEEVQSLGATFVEVELEEETEGEGGYAREVSEAARQRERELLADHIAGSDVVITTALVPGRRAPVLITKEMVAGMEPGSVIVDLAAEQGGNCELTQAGRETVHDGVTILGPVNLPSSMPVHASMMYSRNVSALLNHLIRDGDLHLDFDDEIIDGSCVTHDGVIRNGGLRVAIEQESKRD